MRFRPAPATPATTCRFRLPSYVTRLCGALLLLLFFCFVGFARSQQPQYPYALDSLTRLARNSWADPDFQNLIAPFPDESKQSADALIAHVEHLTQHDVKAVYLKQLQGR